MAERMLLLKLVALLTLLVMAEDNKIFNVRNFRCYLAACKDQLVCDFFLQETNWPDTQYTLTLDDVETTRCKQMSFLKNFIECIYEGIREKKYDNNKNYKFKLRLETANVVQTQEFNRTVIQKSCYTSPNIPDAPKLLENGFYHDLKKAELHIYWQPDKERGFHDTIKLNVTADKGRKASEVTKFFGIFRNWKPEHPANVSICANTWFSDSNCSYLNVPILTNAQERQPQDVWFDINTNHITWKHPKDDDKLVGYTVYWCLISTTNSSNCDHQQRIESQTLNKSQSLFSFKKTLARYHTAVVATYSDEISGGLRWSNPEPIAPYRIWYVVFIVGATILIMFALIVCFLALYRKLRYMENIQVSLPDLQLKLVETPSLPTRYGAAIEGHISPRAIGITTRREADESPSQNLRRQTMRRSSENQYIESRSDRRLSASSDGYGSLPPVPLTVSENSQKVVGYTVMTGNECLENATEKAALGENPYVTPPPPVVNSSLREPN